MDQQPTYQLLPPLSPEAYENLRDDIRANGVRVPIDVDEDGVTIDGHNRQRAAQEEGVPCPTRVVAGLTHEQKREHALTANLHRRQLTPQDRRDLIAKELEHDDRRTDRAIARLIGVHHQTVGSVRRALRGEIIHPAATEISENDSPPPVRLASAPPVRRTELSENETKAHRGQSASAMLDRLVLAVKVVEEAVELLSGGNVPLLSDQEQLIIMAADRLTTGAGWLTSLIQGHGQGFSDDALTAWLRDG